MNKTIKNNRREFLKVNIERDKGYVMPANVGLTEGIQYGPFGEDNTLNLYRPTDAPSPCPVIVHIHGGGFFYGSRERYTCYCADIASRGFGVVNFNYRLAPESHFPAPLHDVDTLIRWLLDNAAQYGLDIDNLFLTGDSAGAQLLATYMAIATNGEYARLFGITAPCGFRPRAIALNAGFYDFATLLQPDQKIVARNYAGFFYRRKADMLNPAAYITAKFPPTYVTTSNGDFLRKQGLAMEELLTERGVEHIVKMYGEADKDDLFHVFNLDVRTDMAKLCNDETCAFFRERISYSSRN